MSRKQLLMNYAFGYVNFYVNFQFLYFIFNEVVAPSPTPWPSTPSTLLDKKWFPKEPNLLSSKYHGFCCCFLQPIRKKNSYYMSSRSLIIQIHLSSAVNLFGLRMYLVMFWKFKKQFLRPFNVLHEQKERSKLLQHKWKTWEVHQQCETRSKILANHDIWIRDSLLLVQFYSWRQVQQSRTTTIS